MNISDRLTMKSLQYQSSIMRAESEYCKIPKYSDTRKVVIIILKFEHCGSTIE